MAERRGSFYLAFLASTHFIVHVYTMLLPVLLLPLQQELGVSLVSLSLLASVPRVVNVFAYIPTGVLGDRYPSRVLTASLVVTAVGAVVVPAARDFGGLLVGFTLLSLGSTLYHPPSLRMASEYDPGRLSLAMGIHNTGSSLGFAAGPLLLGLMMGGWGWRYSFYVWAVLTVAMAAVTYAYTRGVFREAEAEPSRVGVLGGLRSLSGRSFLVVVAMSSLVEAVFNNLVTYLPVYFTLKMGMSYGLTSIVTGLGPLTGILGSFAGGLAGDRYGRYRVGALVLAATGALLVLFPVTTVFWVLLAVYALSRLLQAAYMPLMNGMLAAHSRAENRSLAFSFNFVVVNLFTSATTVAASWLIESYDVSVIFPFSLALLVPAVVLVLLVRDSEK